MAGATIYYTYDTTTKEVKTIHSSAAEATAAIVGGTSAFIEGVTEALNAAGETVDAMLAEPELWYHSDTDPRLREGKIIQYPVRTGLRVAHNRLDELYDITVGVGHNHSPENVQLFQATLHGTHEGLWNIWHRGLLTPAQWARFLQLFALGPADVIKASYTFDFGGGNTWTIKVPTSLAVGRAGNDWTFRITRVNSGTAVFVRETRKIIELTAAPGTTVGEADTRLRTHASITTDDSRRVGQPTPTIAVPGPGQPPNDYRFINGVHYDRNDPESAVDIAETITDRSAFTYRSLSVVDVTDPANLSRRTLAEMLDPANTVAVGGVHPTSLQLDRGRWIERVMM